VTIKPLSPKRFAIALALTEAIVAFSGHAQDISSLESPGATSATARLVVVPALPPILSQRLKLELGLQDIATAALASSTDTAELNGLSSATQRAGAARPPRIPPAAHDGAATRQRYFVTDLGTLGGTESFASSVNDKGDVVGLARLAGDTSTHSFLYRNGRMTDLNSSNSGSVETFGATAINNAGEIAGGAVVDGIFSPAILDSRSGQLTLLGSLGGVTPFGFSGSALAISNHGDAVGYSYTDAINRHAFLYFNGRMTDIGSFGGYSVAAAVNDRGTIVGLSSATVAGRAQAFVHDRGGMRNIDPFGSAGESYARGINNLGDVVGQFLIADQTAHHAFLYKEDVFHDIGFSGSPETVAFAINDEGRVVGATLVPYEDVCFDPSQGKDAVCTKYAEHAFVYEDGRSADLNALIPADVGWELAWAFDINRHGQIVGYGSLNGSFRAFLLTPAKNGGQCKKGAWKGFGFKNKGECIQFVDKDK